MKELIYTKYSNERDRRFAIRTDILEDDGKRFIRKKALYPEGFLHIQKLPELEKKLNQLYGDAFSCNCCLEVPENEKEEDTVWLEYLEGETLEERLDLFLAERRTEEAEQLLIQFLDQIKKIHARVPFALTPEFQKVFGEQKNLEEELASSYMNIDMVCENLILKDKNVVLDYEWTFAFPIPYKFLIYRILFYYLNSNKLRELMDGEKLYARFGITETLKLCFEQMETEFQRYITGNHVPVREMYAGITPGVSVVKTVASSQFQVYFSFGKGYSEENSCLFPIYGEKLQAEVELPDGVKTVRIDPGDHPCSIQIHKLHFDGKAADLGSIRIEQGFIKNNWVYIAKSDPGIENIPVPEGSRKLIAELSIYPASEEMMAGIWKVETEKRHLKMQNEKMAELIHNMKNTKVWKAYQTYRNIIEKKKNK